MRQCCVETERNEWPCKEIIRDGGKMFTSSFDLSIIEEFLEM